jgi:serine/threonine-protein kinase
MVPDEPSGERDPVEQLAEEFVARHRRGDGPSAAEYAERYPQWADRILALFPALLLMEGHRPGASGPDDSCEGDGARAAPPEQLGDYRIIREVGRGGMAVVYEAEQESLGRHVALKVLRVSPQLDPRWTARFRREARTAARLHHTNIVPVYGVGEQDGVHYYVMQFIPGQALDEVLREVRRLRHRDPAAGPPEEAHTRHGGDGTFAGSAIDVARGLVTGFLAPVEHEPWDSGGAGLASEGVSRLTDEAEAAAPTSVRPCGEAPSPQAEDGGSARAAPGRGDPSGLSGPARQYWRGVVRIGVQVAEALEYAHAQGVLHRDVKPSNLLLDLQGTAWVADFGLAKPAGQADLTDAGDIVGTWRYMAPERFRGAADARSDVYSLGLTLYELLTLRPAFEGSTREELTRQVSTAVPTRPRRVNPEVPRDLETIVLKAIEPDPARRYGSAGELAEDLRRFLEDRPIRARRASLVEQAGRWCRRNPALAGVTALAAALLIAVAAVSSIGYIRVTRANAHLEAAHAKVSSANVALQMSNDRERLRFELALEAIRRHHTGVSEDLVLRQEQFKDLRDRLLRDVLDFYRKLEGLLSAQTDDDSSRALAHSYEELGGLTGRLGLVPEALEAHRKALNVRLVLTRKIPSDDTTQFDVGRSLNDIGILLFRSGRYREALESFAEARSVLVGLGGPGPSRDAISAAVARNWLWTGMGLYNTGKAKETMAAYKAGLAIAAPLAEANPELVENLQLLARLQNEIGIRLLVGGETDAALPALEAARQIRRKIADEHPENAEYRQDLAVTLGSIAFVMRNSGRLPDALAAQESSVAILRSLAEAYPGVTEFRFNLANSLIEIGDHSRVLGRAAQSQTSYEQGVAILEGLLDANFKFSQARIVWLQALRGLGAIQLDAGRPGEAVSTLRRVVAFGEGNPFSDPETLNFLAESHALLGRAAGMPGSGLLPGEGPVELDRAMEMLRQAVAAGYWDVAWMRRDPDLDPLRSRADFQVLLLDLAFPADPFSR